MKRNVLLSLTILSLSGAMALSIACKRKQVDRAPDATPVAEEKTAVCVIDGLGLRNAVGKSAKYVSSLALGESVKLVGDPEKDEAGKEWQKITLSDGKAGYVSCNGLVAGAQIGAIKDEAMVYKRPDLLTAQTNKVPFMTIVAVSQQKDQWLQAVGEGKKQIGWIRKDSVTLEKEDVTTAILATKKLREKDGLDQAKKIEAIAAAAPNPNSYFVQKLKEKAASAMPTPTEVPSGVEVQAQ